MPKARNVAFLKAFSTMAEAENQLANLAKKEKANV